MSSLVVEAVKDEAHAPRYAAAMLRRIAVIVWPAAAVVAIGAPWLLMLFGPEYRENATFLLQLLMLTVFPKVVTSLFNTRCRLQNRTGRIAVLQSLQATSAAPRCSPGRRAHRGGVVRARRGGDPGAAARADGDPVAAHGRP